MANETSSLDILRRLNTALVRYDNHTQQFVPELAKSWEVAPDGITWTFHLRKGAAFSDGHPITADDVLFSFQIAYDKVSASRGPGSCCRSVARTSRCLRPMHIPSSSTR